MAVRLYLPKARLQGDAASVRGSDLHYLREVLRLRAGDALEIFDGEGGRYPARVRSMEEDEAALALGARELDQASAWRLVLAQGLPKGEKLELVLQKATELGVHAVVPFQSERTVVKLTAAKAEQRLERWRKIVAEAARQCGRADLPLVRPLCDFEQCLAQAPRGRAALLYEGERNLRLSAFAAQVGPGELWLFVGPEGGFSPAEVEAARKAGAAVVTLGQRVLRTETAALAALAVLQHRLGQLG